MISTPQSRAEIAAQFHLGRVREQADQLRDALFPSGQKGPRKWRVLIDGLIGTADDHLKRVSQNDPSSEQIERHLETAVDCLALAYRCMDQLRGADISELHYTVVKPMQTWFDQLDISYTTLFRAENVANYETRFIKKPNIEMWREPSIALKQVIEDIRWPFIVITVPSRAFGILPHFSVVAHEVGHVLYERIEPEINKIIEPEAKVKYEQIETNVKRRIGKDLDDPQKIRSVFLDWVEEIASDAIGCYIAGPAIFFALSDIFQFGKALPSTTHSSAPIRRRLLYKAITTDPHDFKSVIEGHCSVDFVESFNSPLLPEKLTPDQIYLHALGARYSLDHAAIVAELSPEIEAFGRKIYQEVFKHLSAKHPNIIYTPVDFSYDLECYLEPLLKAIPPIETGIKLDSRDHARFVSILNVGWIALLCHLDNFDVDTSDAPSHLVHGAKAETMHGLLLKAVELSEMKRQWDDPQ